MIMALNGIAIRGEFRTTVDFLVLLLQSDVFITNTYTTAWLDGIIKGGRAQRRAMQSLCAGPPTLVIVALGAVHIADARLTDRFRAYQQLLQRGQVRLRAHAKRLRPACSNGCPCARPLCRSRGWTS